MKNIDLVSPLVDLLGFISRIVILNILLITITYGGIEDYYPPYEKANKPKQTCKIHKINIPASHKLEIGNTIIRVTEKKAEFPNEETYFSFQKKRKGKILPPKKSVADGSFSLSELYWSYLNADNEKDFIVATLTPVDSYSIDFLLSTPQGYSSVGISSDAFSQALFYDYDNDQRCEFLKMSKFIAGGSFIWKTSKKVEKLLRRNGYVGGNGYSPEFVVYNLVYFNNGSAKYKNKLSKYFPRWIEAKKEIYEYGTIINDLSFNQYGNIPNSSEAKLTDQQKKFLWGIYKKNILDKGVTH